MRAVNLPDITTEQMVEVDRLMIEVYGISLVRMMENAGRNLALLGRRLLGGTALGKRIVVNAGKGNNGGGGLVAARHLSNWGANVTVALAGPKDDHKGVVREQLAILEHLPVGIFIAAEEEETGAFGEAALIIDAVIGYGLTGAPRGVPAKLIEMINAAKGVVLSLDVPSGLDASTGEMFRPSVKAAATMTLALPKAGLLAPKAREYVGELYLADIGVPPSLYQRLRLQVGPIFAEESIVRIL